HHREVGAAEGVHPALRTEAVLDCARAETIAAQRGLVAAQRERLGRHVRLPDARLAAVAAVAAQGRRVPRAGARLRRALPVRRQVDLAAEADPAAMAAARAWLDHAMPRVRGHSATTNGRIVDRRRAPPCTGAAMASP